MSPRIIAAPVFGDRTDGATVDAALAVARRFDGQVAGVFVHAAPADAIPIVGEGLSPEVVQQVIDAARTDMERRRKAARATFDAACGRAGVTVAAAPSPGERARAAWREVEGLAEQVLPRVARLSDVVVFGRGADEQIRIALEATLLHGGRPVLVCGEAGELRFDRVALAWKQSLEAARAVFAALPFLGRAREVHVLVADDEDLLAESAELADYLEAHGIASLRRFVPRAHGGAGAALLHAAGEIEADLLVMGAYGHTRLRELVFGGVTQHVLRHARLPVMLTH